MFVRYKEKFKEEKAEIERQLANQGFGVKNLEKCIESALALSSKLATAWNLGDYVEKQRLQNLVFPEGMY